MPLELYRKYRTDIVSGVGILRYIKMFEILESAGKSYAHIFGYFVVQTCGYVQKVAVLLNGKGPPARIAGGGIPNDAVGHKILRAQKRKAETERQIEIHADIKARHNFLHAVYQHVAHFLAAVIDICYLRSETESAVREKSPFW